MMPIPRQGFLSDRQHQAYCERRALAVEAGCYQGDDDYLIRKALAEYPHLKTRRDALRFLARQGYDVGVGLMDAPIPVGMYKPLGGSRRRDDHEWDEEDESDYREAVRSNGRTAKSASDEVFDRQNVVVDRHGPPAPGAPVAVRMIATNQREQRP